MCKLRESLSRYTYISKFKFFLFHIQRWGTERGIVSQRRMLDSSVVEEANKRVESRERGRERERERDASRILCAFCARHRRYNRLKIIPRLQKGGTTMKSVGSTGRIPDISRSTMAGLSAARQSRLVNSVSHTNGSQPTRRDDDRACSSCSTLFLLSFLPFTERFESFRFITAGITLPLIVHSRFVSSVQQMRFDSVYRG